MSGRISCWLQYKETQRRLANSLRSLVCVRDSRVSLDSEYIFYVTLRFLHSTVRVKIFYQIYRPFWRLLPAKFGAPASRLSRTGDGQQNNCPTQHHKKFARPTGDKNCFSEMTGKLSKARGAPACMRPRMCMFETKRPVHEAQTKPATVLCDPTTAARDAHRGLGRPLALARHMALKACLQRLVWPSAFQPVAKRKKIQRAATATNIQASQPRRKKECVFFA